MVLKTHLFNEEILVLIDWTGYNKSQNVCLFWVASFWVAEVYAKDACYIQKDA